MQLSVSYQRNGDLHTIHTGGAALGDIVIDNSRVPAEQRGGTPSSFWAPPPCSASARP